MLVVPPTSYTRCGAQTAALDRVLGACPGTPQVGIGCDTDTLPGQTSLSGAGGCAAIASALSRAATEFRGPAGEAVEIKCGFKDVLYVAAGCDGVAGTLNSMAEAFEAGGFQGCEVTTPTTTATSTPTSTPPTPKFLCKKLFDADLITTEAPAAESCGESVLALNRVFKTCGVAATIECEAQSGGDVVLASADCSGAVGSINHVVNRFRLPASHSEDVKCLHGKYIMDATNCDATAAALNHAIENVATGEFKGCVMTTPTTSRTSTPTSTHTTTATSTPTTSQVSARTHARTHVRACAP